MSNKNFLENLNDLSKELYDILSSPSNVQETNIPDNQNSSLEESIPNFSSEKLCSLIASNRYLKFNEEVEKMAMIELAKRRSNGEVYDFENKIQEMSKSFVPLNTKLPNVYDLLSKIK